jgi:hypothetical protein
MRVPFVEQPAPAAPAGLEIMAEEDAGRHADEFRSGGAELLRHRGIHLRHALVREHVVQHCLLIDARPPFDRLIDHHEEEAILGAFKERFEERMGGKIRGARQRCWHGFS